MSEENMEVPTATTTVELLQKVDKMLNYLVAKQTKEDEAEAAKKELEAAEAEKKAIEETNRTKTGEKLKTHNYNVTV